MIANSIISGKLCADVTFSDRDISILCCTKIQFFNNPHHFTGSTGDRERCPYVFMANSQSDMEEWVRTLRRVIGVPTSGGSVKSSNVVKTISTFSFVLPLLCSCGTFSVPVTLLLKLKYV